MLIMWYYCIFHEAYGLDVWIVKDRHCVHTSYRVVEKLNPGFSVDANKTPISKKALIKLCVFLNVDLKNLSKLEEYD